MSTGVQAVLLGILGFCTNFEWFLGTCMIQRPIVIGPFVGLIMGDFQAGIIMGATMELAFAGAASIGAYDPPDMVSGTILGVALAIKAGAGPEMALTLGLPVASIVLAISNVTGYPILNFFAHLMDKNIADGNDRAFQRNFILSGFVAWGVTTPIVPIAFYLGSDKISALMKLIPEFVQTGMEIAGPSGTDDYEKEHRSVFLYRLFYRRLFRGINNRCCFICNTDSGSAVWNLQHRIVRIRPGAGCR